MTREKLGLAALVVAVVVILCIVLAIVFGVRVPRRDDDLVGAIYNAMGNANSSLGAAESAFGDIGE